MTSSPKSNLDVLSIEELRKIFSVLTHDLRSPLFAIDGFSNLLIDDIGESLSEENRDFLERIRASARHMKETIDEMNRIVKLLTRPVQIEETDLQELVAQLWFRLHSRAEENNVTAEIADDLPVIQADSEKLSAALAAIIDNAISFRKRDDDAATTIRISSKREDDGLHICVRDTGIGIEQPYVEQIFSPGIKLDREATEGPGYGLFLARRVAEIHGGKIHVESESGEGSTFCIVLPSS